MKVRETQYKGITFRSRLEARWAIFFDTLGLKWEYEPEGFQLNQRVGYLPDFFVHGVSGIVGGNNKQKDGLYIEIKGDLKQYDRVKLAGFEYPIFVVGNQEVKDTIDYVLDIEDELLPEEKMVQAYQHYLKDLRFALIERVRACHPSFFEKMVVDLLLAMGYGCDDKSGQVIGKSHDGGIDGIISEDKLGLNLIYIQAKRYNEGNNVGRPEIQRFIGAMQRAEKGVFITTSKFTREAIEFANAENRKHIRLIDGENLVELMIKHSVGLEKIKEYVVYKINEDYFSDLM